MKDRSLPGPRAIVPRRRTHTDGINRPMQTNVIFHDESGDATDAQLLALEHGT
jgi:hypothetical protein